MSLLKSLANEEGTKINNERDSVGGGGALESGLYPAKVAMAYLNKAASGALALVLTLKTEDNREIRQSLWMTSGTAKGGKNYYEDKNGEKHFLPGFNHANSLALLTVGTEISDLDTETKLVNVYSSDAKAEVPTKVEVVMDLLGKDIIVGLIKQTVDKSVKNDATGAYEPTGETREENEIDKFFRASDRMTTSEIRAKATEPGFIDTWDAKWTGKSRDKTSGAATGAAKTGAPKAAATPGAGKKPTTSLFGTQ